MAGETMGEKFRNAEKSFERLKRQFRSGKISRQEFIEGLTELKLQDDEGRFWMIGVRSGKWYYLDGKTWRPSEPPSFEERKSVCISCGFENRLEAETCAGCGENLREGEGASTQETDRSGEASYRFPFGEVREGMTRSELREGLRARGKSSRVLRSLLPLPFFFFCAVMGLILGAVTGAFTGATDFFPAIARIVPPFIQEIKGNLLGGIIYAFLGGVIGSVVSGLFGLLSAFLINLVSSLVGGIRVQVEPVEKR